jgi:hypothetical protein
MAQTARKLPPLTSEDIRNYIREYQGKHYFIDEFDEFVGPYETRAEAIAALEAYQP